MKNSLSISSKAFLLVSAVMLIISIFVPIWQIELDAPQYPEGLGLKIFANRLAGDVDIINGLNHYIGMKNLNSADFIEFTVLIYIISFFAGFAILTAFVGKRSLLYTLFILFVLFGTISMIDFWRWEYDYGHNLNPHAAIIVPGMAYQPPLIGFRQLLNFGAYSIPDIGGWLFIGSGLLMLCAILLENGLFKKIFSKKTQNMASVILLLCFTNACKNDGPEAIELNKDHCDNCGMSISDKRFACELITPKGRAYKFDDISCMMDYDTENKTKTTNSIFYISDYLSPNELILSSNLTYLSGKGINSPMQGNIASFANKDSANAYHEKLEAESVSWDQINK